MSRGIPFGTRASALESAVPRGRGDRLEADSFVVGSHGRGGIFDLVVSSVSSGVIRRSRMPVLVVPARD
ncbi:MAG TPA: universal stress protein [Gemmatimonadota bacterium]|nr:universal stress protein [Gemmatimonadota bacterium]